MKKRIIGIMGAMPEEISGIVNLIKNPEVTELGMRTYYQGEINDVNVVVVFSRWGKIAASTTVSTLINRFNITELIFTGVAGAIAPNVKVGDIVLSQRVIQHDMDSRPLMPQYVVPLHNKIFFETSENQINRNKKVIREFIDNHAWDDERFKAFRIEKPTLWIGDIASGDQFFSNNEQKQNLATAFPSVLCVEMEGAAVGQICFEYNIPWIIIRTISDSANNQAHIDFPLFIEEVASLYSVEIIKRAITNNE